MKTFQAKKSEIERSWHLFDAKDQILGRLSTQIATILMGKNKPSYTAHMDNGDFVVVVNSEKINVTKNKEQDKLYRRHSNYPGGFKEENLASLRKRKPQEIIYQAVKRMLPDNRLRDKRLKRLHLIIGDNNPFILKFNSK